MMKNVEKSIVPPHLDNDVVTKIRGFQLCAYLIAYEGWRRGLILRWHQNETKTITTPIMKGSTIGKFFSLSSDNNTHYFYRSRGDMVGNQAVDITREKDNTKQYFIKNNVPTPRGKEFKSDSVEEILKYANTIEYPVVVKPVDGSMGRGVFTNIQNDKDLAEILEYYKSKFKENMCIVEKHFFGEEYRIYVVGNKAVSVVNRIPANITGDGLKTINQLIKEKNKQRKSNPYLAIKPIKIDYEIRRNLESHQLTTDSILKKGETFYLRNMSNLSAGGDPIDETIHVTDEVKEIAIKALRALPSIPHAGVDVIIDETNDKKAVVLEVNATAEIGFHSFPLCGKVQDVPAAIIDHYFPETIGMPKSNFYFDFNSILEPLKTSTAQFVQVSNCPQGDVYGLKYTVMGKVKKVNYMNWIKRQALKNGFHGNIKLLNDETAEVLLWGIDKKRMQEFINVVKKGSRKSKVKDVKVEEMEMELNKNVKVGFEII